MKAPSRAVVTLALGSPLYLTLATNLARSFLHWHRDDTISFHIITDRPVTLAPDLAAIKLITVTPGKYGTGFMPKLWLDQLVPAEQNLFIDSDCLCFGSLTPVFNRFAGRTVGVVGEMRTEGHFFGDIPSLRRALDLPWMASFVGCLYYLEKGPQAAAVYAEARRLEKDYDALGVIRLKGLPNEEPLMALSLPRHGQTPIPDDGTIKADAMYYRRILCLDVIHGHAHLIGPLGDHNRTVVPEARPVLFHFNAYFTEGRHYRRETARLRLVKQQGWPVAPATAWVYLRYDRTAWLTEKVKTVFRPFFRRIFGTRKVRGGER